MHPVFFVCATCGSVVSPLAPSPFRCPREAGRPASGSGHRLVREIDPRQLSWPDLGPPSSWLRFRALLGLYLRFRSAGGTDREWVERIHELETALRAAGRGDLLPPPVRRAGSLEVATDREGAGAVWFRPQAERPRGELVGLILPAWLDLDREIFRIPDEAPDSGEARGLAEALDLPVADRRGTDGSPGGDSGIPLTRENRGFAPAFEAATLPAYEVVDHLRRVGAVPDRVFLPPDPDAALAAAIGFREAFRIGSIRSLPRFHLAEPSDAPIFLELFEAALDFILDRVHPDLNGTKIREAARRFPRVRQEIADSLTEGLRASGGPVRQAVEDGLREARDALDSDLALVRMTIESGGFPVDVSLETLSRVVPEPPEDGSDPGDGSGRGTRAVISPSRALAAAGLLTLAESDDLPSEEVIVVLEG